MKKSKEIITGLITIIAIVVLVAGVNFLKGNSFFGGDEVYYAYFSNSGFLSNSSNVSLNGVTVGKVMSIENVSEKEYSAEKAVKVSFTIQDDNIIIPKGSYVEIGPIDLLSKGMMLHCEYGKQPGNHVPGDVLPGKVAVEMMDQVKMYADPIVKKLQKALGSIDNMVNGVSAFWDSTASSELEGTFKELKFAIHKFGDAANDIQGLVADEKVKLSRILTNVEVITVNLKKSNEKVKQIVGNVATISDDLVTSDFTGTIENAKKALNSVNEVLKQASSGEGTLGKLLGDDALYNELVQSNKELQELINDINVHPERYIHFSVFGAKTKGVPLSNTEEEKLKTLLDSIP